MPRSGTTIVFERFSRHEQLGWLSNYNRIWPSNPWLNVFRRVLDNRLISGFGSRYPSGFKRVVNRFLPYPDEAYEFWEHWTVTEFSRGVLSPDMVSAEMRDRVRSAVDRTVRWQAKSRFAAKLTGPPRIHFLRQLFADAMFVNLIRDGRAVVHSLLRVHFWREKHGLTAPFWDNLLIDTDLAIWNDHDQDAGVLAALQWKRMIERSREEASRYRDGQYVEVRYEDIVADPHGRFSWLHEYLGLPDSGRSHDALNSGRILKDMNFKFREQLDASYVASLTDVMQPVLGELGYA